MDLLFRGGTVVTDGLEFEADLGVTGGRVSHLGLDLQGDSQTQIVEAKGRYLFPGAVEMLSGVKPFAAERTEDRVQWITGLAAVGGVTTLVVPADPVPGRSVRDVLEFVRPVAEANAFVDFGIHLSVSSRTDQAKGWIREAPGVGIASVWVDSPEDGQPKEDVTSLVWSAARESGDGLLVIAPVWDSLLDAVVPAGERAVTPVPGSPGGAAPASGNAAGPSFPGWLEMQVVERMTGLMGAAGIARLLLRSVSGRSALETLKKAREEGARILAAASLAHLVARINETPDQASPPLPCWPPLRGKADQSFLWFLLDEGLIPIVTSSRGMGEGANPFDVAGAGHHPAESLALLWSLLHTEGVVKNRLGLTTLVQAVSGDAAKLAGLYPTKGSLMIGSDADIVVFNPEIEWSVGGPPEPTEDLDGEGAAEAAAKKSSGPFTGWPLRGAIEHVYLRGQPLVVEHELTAEPGKGRYLERKLQVR